MPRLEDLKSVRTAHGVFDIEDGGECPAYFRAVVHTEAGSVAVEPHDIARRVAADFDGDESIPLRFDRRLDGRANLSSGIEAGCGFHLCWTKKKSGGPAGRLTQCECVRNVAGVYP